jgi:Tol biopolymer transport system component/tRNA A-37 threonylcarbamoyl transferase component Bud32
MSEIPSRLTAALADRYAIERELGEGGMATVYLAEDLKHKRKVALKVLRPELAAVLGAERFVQEIETTASLQHPHILPLFDSGQVDGFLYYVMPYIEGETLRDKLNRETQLGIDEAVRITTEVADALDYAHRQGVIHRDIKPENILLHDGRPMVADFGIALAVSAAAGGRMTETGLSLGTPHYMSPEQATADKDIPARSDVYSLASVMYEMLAGEPPHMGNTAQAIIMKIIAEPVQPVTELRKSAPPNVAAALAKALEKLPADRFASAKDFAEALTNPAFTSAVGVPGARAVVTRSRLRTVATVSAAAAIIATALAAWGWLRSPEPRDEQVVRFALPMQDSAGAASYGVVSPDGSMLVMAVTRQDSTVLVQRPLNGLDAAPLALESTRVAYPFYSPDGTQLGLIDYSGSSSTIRIMRATGGPSRTLTDRVSRWGGPPRWGDDGYIYFDTYGYIPVRMSSEGGPLDTLYVSPAGGAGMVVPLPGGEGIIFLEGPTTRSLSIATLDLTTGEHRVLSEGGPYVDYLPSGHLLFTRGRSLMAAPFDVKSLELTAEPVPVAEVPTGTIGWFAYGGGTLVFRGTTSPAQGPQPVLIDREGNARPLANLPPGRNFAYPAASPDGRRFAVRVATSGTYDAQYDIWTYELPEGPLTRLTLEGTNDDPSWSPDGRSVMFDSNRTGGQEVGGRALYLRPWDGSGPAEMVLQRKDAQLWRTSWLPDGRRFAFYEIRQGNSDVGLAVLGAPDSTRLLLSNPAADEEWPEVSPDGRWLAYTSNESGRTEVYVRPLEGQGTRRQVSLQGGDVPVWARSGRELFFVRRDSVYAAALDLRNGIEVETVRALFALPCCGGSGFDVFPGDSLFVGLQRVEGETPPDDQPVVVVYNFAAELRARMGGSW